MKNPYISPYCNLKQSNYYYVNKKQHTGQFDDEFGSQYYIVTPTRSLRPLKQPKLGRKQQTSSSCQEKVVSELVLLLLLVFSVFLREIPAGISKEIERQSIIEIELQIRDRERQIGKEDNLQKEKPQREERETCETSFIFISS